MGFSLVAPRTKGFPEIIILFILSLENLWFLETIFLNGSAQNLNQFINMNRIGNQGVAVVVDFVVLLPQVADSFLVCLTEGFA